MSPSPARVISIDAGMVMVVTDLHGDGPLYRHYRDVFLALRARGLVETLVITGDFVHSEGPEEADASLEIVLDLLRLRETLGEHLVVLLGNHELPHLYHIPLMKGQHCYTPRFEAAMGQHRAAILAFFDALPLYARSRAGVALTHAGAITEAEHAAAMSRICDFSHRRLLDEAAARAPASMRPRLRRALGEMEGVPYADLAREYLAVAGPADPRYNDYLLGQLASSTPAFGQLWAALFSRNEHARGHRAYAASVRRLLAHLSEGYAPQTALVAGHIGCRGGYRIVAEGQQLRLASGAHAHPYTSARYLLFDAAKPVAQAEDLLGGVGGVFKQSG